jgi:hypothetical protein
VVPIFTTDKISIISSLQGAKAAPSGPIRTNIPAPELIQLGFLEYSYFYDQVVRM